MTPGRRANELSAEVPPLQEKNTADNEPRAEDQVGRAMEDAPWSQAPLRVDHSFGVFRLQTPLRLRSR